MSEAILKAIASVKDVGDDSDTGAFEVALSTPDKDRDGDELLTKDWAPLPDHITFDIDHGMSVASTVGSGTPSFDDEGRMIVKGTYASTPLAQETRTLVKEGHIRSVSVAYLERVTKAADGKTSRVRELLNGAFVAVPANPNAMVLSSKSLADASAKAVVVKALAQSYEERQAAVYEELCDLFGDSYETWCWIIATFDDHVVYHVCSPIDAIEGDYTVDYTVDADGDVTLSSAPQRVTITQIVTVVTQSVTPTSVEHSGSAADTDAAADKAAASASATDETALATPDDIREAAEARAAVIETLLSV